MANQPDQLRVRNWETFQHYKERNPPWIKLHFALLASEDWVTLDDASRLLAVVCMMVASRNKGMVPNNPAYIKRVAYLDHSPDFAPLISCGFLEKPLADASTAQADARPEERQRREEVLSETSSDARPKKSRKEYPEAFESAWLSYPRDPNMSKAESFDAWKKLDAADKDALAASIPAFVAYCRANPNYRPIHMCRYIAKRRFDGHGQPQPSVPIDETAWRSRMKLARAQSTWSTAEWGPRPGETGCLVPKHLLEAGDGQNWREWENAA